jgi:tetratricopeptide (TPR) repeat protein
MNQTFELFLSGTNIPHRYMVSMSMPSDAATFVKDFFELRSDSVELIMTLDALEKAASREEKPGKDLYVEFGKRMYELLFSGAIGESWRERRKRAGDIPLALVLRVDPVSARFLQRIPWEYLHDGKDFLATNCRTPVYHLPPDIKPADLKPLQETLRMLVVIAAPVELNRDKALNSAREEDLILIATSEARKAGKLQLEFTPNGALETLEEYLREYNPHLLHFVGHGFFAESVDSGLLLMETFDGHTREVWNKDFTEVLVENGRELRGVFLSACQSAVAPRVDGFADLAPRLLEQGIPMVIAMQHSILDTSAMLFGSVFYKGVVEGMLIEDAFTDARRVLKTSSPNSVDFATPVLFLSDPDCLQLASLVGQSVETPMDLGGLTKAQDFVGRTTEIRELQTKLDPQTGTWRAVVIHAIGGMGKTVLAARLAERMATRLDGVISIRITPSTTAKSVLDHIGDFLFSNNARFNLSEIHQYQENRSKPLELNIRIGALTQILRRLRILLIFDNCEDILPYGMNVSRAAKVQESASLDPELLPLISVLVDSADGLTRLLFTSRVDFSPIKENHLTDAIGHLSLKEMRFQEVVYLMETLPPLDDLPVAILNQINAASFPRLVTMRDVFERVGGHPYRLNLFAKHAANSSIDQALDDLSGMQQDLLEFTLLEKAVEQLPKRTILLLRRASVYDEPVPKEGLAFMLGDERDVMPDVSAELKTVLKWGLVAPELDSDAYSVHSIVREWIQSQWSETEKKEYLHRASQYWLGLGRDSRSLWDYLRARQYLYQAEEYEDADEIVQTIYEYLLRSGYLSLLLLLLQQSVNTLEGTGRTVALGNLATIYQELGDNQTAKQIYKQVLKIFEKGGDKGNMAVALHEIGIVHQRQGEYQQALVHYQESRKIFEEIGDRTGVANSLYQVGKVYESQGEYQLALNYFQQSLKIEEQIGDGASLARTLNEIGILHQMQGEYQQALKYYQQSLNIDEKIGYRASVASSLHNIGMLHQMQGEYSQALEYYQQSLEIKEETGDRPGVASSLHNIGMLYQMQGGYSQALEYYQQSLENKEEIGDRPGVAYSLHQIGTVCQAYGEYRQALEYYQRSLKILEGIGDQAGLAASLHEIGMLHYLQGKYLDAYGYYLRAMKINVKSGDRAGEAKNLHNIGMLYQMQGGYSQALEYYQQSLEIQEEIGDQSGVANSMHQIGMLYQDQTEYDQAREYYQQSLKTREAIGDRQGIAYSLGQLGLLHEQMGQLEQAISVLIQAFIMFSEMGMSQAEQAQHALSRLHSKIGEAAFLTAVRATGLPNKTQSTLFQVLVDSPGQWDTQNPNLREALILKMISVLREGTEKKGEWWNELSKLERKAKGQHKQDLTMYLHGLVRLLEGGNPVSLTASIPDEFKSDWQAILDGMSQKE